MRIKIIVAILVLSIVCPPLSHGFGLLRYTFDAIRNQLGLDRGPIPKTMQHTYNECLDQQCPAPSNNPDVRRIYIQAEGF